MIGRRPSFSRPIRTYEDALDEGVAWGEYYAGRGRKPRIHATPHRVRRRMRPLRLATMLPLVACIRAGRTAGKAFDWLDEVLR